MQSRSLAQATWSCVAAPKTVCSAIVATRWRRSRGGVPAFTSCARVAILVSAFLPGQLPLTALSGLAKSLSCDVPRCGAPRRMAVACDSILQQSSPPSRSEVCCWQGSAPLKAPLAPQARRCGALYFLSRSCAACLRNNGRRRVAALASSKGNDSSMRSASSSTSMVAAAV